ncbi:Rossmann-like and DUF2520 domain-containing protein [Ruminococcus flavefaciens]|jgi:predicted short-subunit dehydrogenase-like oxidoreductase (DUF2520 family)|uniref:Rossmann-like and DUF2520 domain-containing protein n=1 Tax=Ruminococcus flavefaciens TaxID=1265 RepID=UPI0004657242|nr:Rossmann-like and DUF2520 domain-containing protein [Ruminococcus flavefaciens]
MKIGFIGAGKVGFSLGRYFAENGIFITGYFSRVLQSATEAARFTKSRAYDSMAELVTDSDVIFLTVPDDAIKEVYDQVKAFGISGKQICHCSGAMSVSDAFPDIARYGASGFSIHPLFPISSKYDSFKELGKAFFCIEGSDEFIGVWDELLRKMGNGTKMISSENKAQYNAACAISSNLVCALAAESLSLMEKCGFSQTEALKAFQPLVMSHIKRILAVGPVEALSGPVERNDVGTIRKHIECMESDTDKSMYKAVSMKLIDVAQQKNNGADYSDMIRALR